MEAHGGYLSRLQDFDLAVLLRVAKQALIADGKSPAECSLLVSVLPHARLLRLAFDGVHTYGRRGAHWYEMNHSLPRLLSSELGITVHAYVLDPDELELVVGYAGGRRVGGDLLRYEEAELPDDEEGELDERAFDKLKARWPLGHLATVLGVSREELIRIPRAATALLEFDGTQTLGKLLELFPPAPRSRFARLNPLRPKGRDMARGRFAIKV